MVVKQLIEPDLDPIFQPTTVRFADAAWGRSD
jgi:hypothetical protein